MNWKDDDGWRGFLYNLFTSENYESEKQTRNDKAIYWLAILGIAALVIIAMAFIVVH